MVDVTTQILSCGEEQIVHEAKGAVEDVMQDKSEQLSCVRAAGVPSQPKSFFVMTL